MAVHATGSDCLPAFDDAETPGCSPSYWAADGSSCKSGCSRCTDQPIPFRSGKSPCSAAPVPMQASAAREKVNLSVSEAALDAASRAGCDGLNGAAEDSSARPSVGMQGATAGPSAPVAGAGRGVADARDAGAALQDFASMLSRKKRHYFMVSNGGIPIYSRHGRAHDTAGISALLYSIVSLSLDALGVPLCCERHRGIRWGLDSSSSVMCLVASASNPSVGLCRIIDHRKLVITRKLCMAAGSVSRCHGPQSLCMSVVLQGCFRPDSHLCMLVGFACISHGLMLTCVLVPKTVAVCDELRNSQLTPSAVHRFAQWALSSA